MRKLKEGNSTKVIEHFRSTAIIVCILSGFSLGALVASWVFESRYPNYKEQTYHYELVYKGYNYCPYCGKEIKEEK